MIVNRSRKIVILVVISLILLLTPIFVAYYLGYFGENFSYSEKLSFKNLKFKFPVDLIPYNDKIIVLEKQGKMFHFSNNPNVKNDYIFADLSSKIYSQNTENGLLSAIIDQNENQIYLFYTELTTENTSKCLNPCIQGVLARYDLINSNIENKINFSSEFRILEIPEIGEYHRGGTIRFGPDNMLYLSIGDSATGLGQDRTNLYGSIIRIDITKKNPNLNYSIPLDNPFYNNTQGFRKEIWAYGFRNPWRFSFDPLTGKLFVGDVGNARFEEVDIVQKGANYGWNITEGPECYGTKICNRTGLTPPLLTYPHPDTYPDNVKLHSQIYGDAVLGGFVYRGSKFPEFQGKYIFADFDGFIWSVGLDSSLNSVMKITSLTRNLNFLSSISEDNKNELYFIAYSSILPSSTNTGNIYSLVRNHILIYFSIFVVFFVGLILLIIEIKKRKTSLTDKGINTSNNLNEN